MDILAYKFIIWDWNGTLLNDLDLCHSLINGVLTRRGIEPLSLQRYTDIFTFPVKKYYETAGLDFTNESFEIVGKEWMDEYEARKHECTLNLDAEAILRFFQEKGLKQCILSAYSQHTLEEIVDSFGLTAYFHQIRGLSDIYAAGKLQLGQLLITDLQAAPGEALLIGDTLHDFEVAKGIGADCILIADGHQSRERLESAGVPVFDSLASILNSLR